ncbi:MAG: hypothetical protein ABSE93_12660 [Terriglobia bacterium]|jgi:hypothetical protein
MRIVVAEDEPVSLRLLQACLVDLIIQPRINTHEQGGTKQNKK